MKVALFVCLTLVNAIIINADHHIIADCSELDIDTITAPISGSDLKYCQRNASQCCDNSYFNGRFNEIYDLINATIQNEITLQFTSLGMIVDGMESYLKNTFVKQFSRNFCSDILTQGQCDTAIDPAEQTLRNNLYINEDEETDPTIILDENSGFSTAAAVSAYLADSINGIADYYLADRVETELTTVNRDCLIRMSSATPEQERYVYDNLTAIRQSFTALRRLRTHLNTAILPNLRALKPTNSCIESFINIRCDACVEDIPETCRGACNALTFGCLAPFRDGIGAQFDLMWNVTRQIVKLTNNIIPNARIIPRIMAFGINISDTDAIRSLAAECGITVTTSTTNIDSNDNTNTNDNDGDSTNTNDNDGNNSSNDDDDDDDGLPDNIVDIAEDRFAAGAFNNSEPAICQDHDNEDCWNGVTNVTINDIDFTNKTVAGQENNPVANYNVTNLERSSNNMDMFIIGFLKSPYFLDVLPPSIVIPGVNRTDIIIPINGTDPGDGNDGANIISTGYMAFFALLILGLLIN